MTFPENLIRLRKNRGLSQEELAAHISVSRQAVSKWENGDAMPDLNNLLLLAQALEVTLDELCKGEAPAQVSSPAPEKPRKPWGLIVLCIVLALMLLPSLVLLFNISARTEQNESQQVQIITEELSVTGVNFHGLSITEVNYQFTPSISGKHLQHEITFTASDGKSLTFTALEQNGVCAGYAKLDSGFMGYTVTISVVSGSERKNIAVANNLTFSEGHASWTPLD